MLGARPPDLPHRGMPAASVPATADTSSQVASLVELFLVCSALGEPLRVWGLYSDAYLTRILARERGYDRARYGADREPKPSAAADSPALQSISVIAALGDTHAMATVVIWYPNLDRAKTLMFWFVLIDGDWRIDEIDGEITFAVP